MARPGHSRWVARLEEISYPHSIGMLWERIAVYLGFTEFDACKIMGLAAFGDDRRFAAEFDRLFPVLNRDGGLIGRDQPPFRIDAELARLRSDRVSGLESLFGPRRKPEDPPELGRFADVAACLQRQTEEAVSRWSRRLAQATGERNLVFAGGVALNCLANARLERDKNFESLFVLGAAHDAGTAIGAALATAYEQDAAFRAKRDKQRHVLDTVPGAPRDENAAIEAAIARSGFSFERVPNAAGTAAKLIAEGQIVGWFQGRGEFGPRCGQPLAPGRPSSRAQGKSSIAASSTESPSGCSGRQSFPRKPIIGLNYPAIAKVPPLAGAS